MNMIKIAIKETYADYLTSIKNTYPVLITIFVMVCVFTYILYHLLFKIGGLSIEYAESFFWIKFTIIVFPFLSLFSLILFMFINNVSTTYLMLKYNTKVE